MATQLSEPVYGCFETTRWTLVEMLQSDADDECREAALEELCSTYWPPIFGFLRGSGIDCEKAAEFTQSFFAEVVLSRKLFQRVDRSRARLRVLLISALKNYMIDAHRSAKAYDRRLAFIREAATRYEKRRVQTDDGSELDMDFDREWALQVLEISLHRCAQRFRGAGREGHWQVYYERVVRPCIAGCAPTPTADLAIEHGFQNEAAVNSAVHVVRKRLMAILHETVQEHVANEDESREEFDYLVSLIESSQRVAP